MTLGNDPRDPRKHPLHASEDTEQDEHRWMGPDENPASDPDRDGVPSVGPEENPASGGEG